MKFDFSASFKSMKEIELGSPGASSSFIVTPHAQRERGKVIGRGVHIYIYMYIYIYVYIYIYMSVVEKKI